MHAIMHTAEMHKNRKIALYNFSELKYNTP